MLELYQDIHTVAPSQAALDSPCEQHSTLPTDCASKHSANAFHRDNMMRGIPTLLLALVCSHQLISVAAVVASPNSAHNKNLPRRALMSANANQVLPAAAWTLALAGLHVVQAISEGPLPVYIYPQGQLLFD